MSPNPNAPGQPGQPPQQQQGVEATVAPATGGEGGGADYTAVEWSGKPLYQCSRCPFNSAQEQAVIEHVAHKHAGQPPAPTQPA